jgi:SAM-dependent methyltransferase
MTVPALSPPSDAASELVAATASRRLRRETDMAFRRRALTVLEWLGREPGGRVLDCGCGRGFYLAMLAGLGRRGAVGVDLDLGALRRARTTGEPAAPPGSEASAAAPRPARVARAGALRLPFADASFDAVILSEVIEHVPDDVAALREAGRVVRPGGAVLITVPHAGFPFAWDPLNFVLGRLGRPIRRGPLAGIWAHHLRLYTPETLRAAVAAAGLVVEEERAQTRRCLPFTHNLLYGLGKPLHDWAPARRLLGDAFERAHATAGEPHPLHPAALALRLLAWADRGNRDAEADPRATVNLLLRACRPRPRPPE